MGRHGKRRRKSSPTSSSSSSSDSEPGPKRGPAELRNRSKTTAVATENRRETPTVAADNRSRTPPPTDSLRIERLEKLVQQLAEQNKDASSTVKAQVTPHIILKPDLLPEFTPGNPNLTCEKWIQKIDQLATVHNWSDSVIIYHMVSRLTGLAKNWYHNLDPSSYDLKWEKWKELLLTTFPDHQDFATTLRKMVAREKEERETWAQYYFGKLSLLQACKISGKDAVSCLIDGIKDPTLRNGAIAGRYKSPEQLYTEYLSTLKTEVQPNQIKQRLTFDRRRMNVPVDRSADRQRRPYVARCYNCKQEGHFADKCPKPRVECRRCRRLGHTEKECKRDAKSTKTGQVMQADCEGLINHTNYLIDVSINGQNVKAYVDSGAGPVLITSGTAKRLGLV